MGGYQQRPARGHYRRDRSLARPGSLRRTPPVIAPQTGTRVRKRVVVRPRVGPHRLQGDRSVKDLRQDGLDGRERERLWVVAWHHPLPNGTPHRRAQTRLVRRARARGGSSPRPNARSSIEARIALGTVGAHRQTGASTIDTQSASRSRNVPIHCGAWRRAQRSPARFRRRSRIRSQPPAAGFPPPRARAGTR
jgi:hypothetical protein